MARRKGKGGFFNAEVRPEDEIARSREVEALAAPRRAMLQDLPVERIDPNPFQARQAFEGLDELAAAMQAHGFTTRLRVRPHPAQPNRFQLVFGERRLRAARQAGLSEVPCEVADHTDDEMIEIGLAENIQRRDLTPLEEAQAFRQFREQRGYSIRYLAERIGKDKSYIEDRLKLLSTPDDVQAMIAERPDALRSAREIARLPDAEERRPLIDGVVGGTLTTADVRALVRETTDPTQSIERTLQHDLRKMQAILARWQALQDQGTDAHALVSAAAAELLHEIEGFLPEGHPASADEK